MADVSTKRVDLNFKCGLFRCHDLSSLQPSRLTFLVSAAKHELLCMGVVLTRLVSVAADTSPIMVGRALVAVIASTTVLVIIVGVDVVLVVVA